MKGRKHEGLEAALREDAAGQQVLHAVERAAWGNEVKAALARRGQPVEGPRELGDLFRARSIPSIIAGGDGPWEQLPEDRRQPWRRYAQESLSRATGRGYELEWWAWLLREARP